MGFNFSALSHCHLHPSYVVTEHIIGGELQPLLTQDQDHLLANIHHNAPQLQRQLPQSMPVANATMTLK